MPVTRSVDSYGISIKPRSWKFRFLLSLSACNSKIAPPTKKMDDANKKEIIGFSKNQEISKNPIPIKAIPKNLLKITARL